jgi:hypothetical protein
MKIWTCKIGECEEDDLLTAEGKYYGADAPMRQAIREAYIKITGKEPNFIFSGWGGKLTGVEREVANKYKKMGT